MKRRGLASPDLADALALTFAWPVLSRDDAGGEGPRRPLVEIEYDPFAMARGEGVMEERYGYGV